MSAIGVSLGSASQLLFKRIAYRKRTINDLAMLHVFRSKCLAPSRQSRRQNQAVVIGIFIFLRQGQSLRNGVRHHGNDSAGIADFRNRLRYHIERQAELAAQGIGKFAQDLCADYDIVLLDECECYGSLFRLAP